MRRRACPPAAAHRRLDDDRIAELLGQLASLLGIADRLVAAGQDRHLGLLGDPPGRHLVAELLQHLDAWPDEDDAGLLAGSGERGVLRQKTVAGMNGIDVVLLGQRHDAVDVEIGPQRFAGDADAIGLVGLEAVQGEAILVRVDGHGANAQFVGRAKDANGDLAAIGDEKFADGRGHVWLPWLFVREVRNLIQ